MKRVFDAPGVLPPIVAFIDVVPPRFIGSAALPIVTVTAPSAGAVFAADANVTVQVSVVGSAICEVEVQASSEPRPGPERGRQRFQRVSVLLRALARPCVTPSEHPKI